MEGDHAVEKQVLLPLGNRFSPSGFSHEHGQLPEMLLHETPDAVHGTSL